MGWFGSDEIENNISTNAHDTAQTMAKAVVKSMLVSLDCSWIQPIRTV